MKKRGGNMNPRTEKSNGEAKLVKTLKFGTTAPIRQAVQHKTVRSIKIYLNLVLSVKNRASIRSKEYCRPKGNVQAKTRASKSFKVDKIK